MSPSLTGAWHTPDVKWRWAQRAHGAPSKQIQAETISLAPATGVTASLTLAQVLPRFCLGIRPALPVSLF